KRVQPPEPSYQQKLADRYAHKGPTWRSDIWRRLNGEFADTAQDDYFFGEVNGNIVGGLWTTTPRDTRDVATLGHVFTDTAHRQKGVCDFLMQAMTQAFRDEGGQAMYLATGNPVARRIYEKYGFRLYNPPRSECDGVFQWVVSNEPHFEERYFAPAAPLRVREVVWGDLPRFEALYNCPHPWLLKDEGLNVYRDVGYESQFLSVMRAVEEQRSACLVLENARRVVVGVARLTKSDGRWSAHVATLELFVHPFYFADAAPLLQEVLDRCDALRVEVVHAYAANSDDVKSDLLLRAGFHPAAHLLRQFKVGDEMHDLLIFSRRR
ncbi:MAG: GNAT family N-acetyltransferase, partial [Abditibacteriales bacterium]|nr:GNAT family N-acetyltransferase [Abditibacteriales bacterium]MDW8366555.1 GNAT family N-acetyltransferase [Abditibacteriales bacterium]